MKTIKFLLFSVVSAAALTLLAANDDPVLMTVNGKDVKLSEFEYLYQKNNNQPQIEKESLDKYVERFVLYKRKVADAEAYGIDTLRTFKQEYNSYKTTLEKPYLEDSTYRKQLEREAYERMHKNVKIDHIMLQRGATPEEDKVVEARIDSIRTCILQGQSWDEMTEKFSVDPSKANNQGHYPYITANSYPYEFEMAAFTTPVGEITKPVRTNFGWHLIRVVDVRDDDGTVNAAHILKLYPSRNPTEEQRAAVKASMDSIYQLLVNGADFAEIASRESQDNASAKRGGEIGWFGRGRMFPQFEEMCYKLSVGEISEPLEMPYGVQIIKKLGHKPTPTFEEARKLIDNNINRDVRSQMIRDKKIEQLKSTVNFQDNYAKVENYLNQALAANGQYDSTFVVDVLAKSDMPVYTFNGTEKATLSDIAPKLNKKAKFTTTEQARDYIMKAVEPYAEKHLTDYYRDHLMEVNTEYRNLMTEYRDGMLMFEISNRKVWNGASVDTVGLRQYYEANRAKYDWNEPHFKGIILAAVNDTVLNDVKADIAAMAPDTLTAGLHNKYGNKIHMSRMTVKQGENEIADYVVFHTAPKPANSRYSEYMMLEPLSKIINNPEGLEDVRGMVTSDYQDVLEQRWEKELAQKYPVHINKKVLKRVKKL